MHQIWYDDARIERTVKRNFVCSYLDPEEIENLDKPLLFGDGLTNDTYWDWLETKAKRLFLILLELDLPDQIFGVIDDSWEDDDLPIPLDQIHRLALTEERDLRLEKRFYDLQFSYLLRTLQRGEHVDYGDQELVPLEIVDRRPVSSHQDTVILPQYPGRLFSRRGIQLGLHMSREEFMYEISLIRDLQNEHIESYFASYTHHDHAYVLFTPACEYKLSSYLSNTPTTLKNVDKVAKRLMVLDWIHCLVDTLGFIHSNGEALGNLKPSIISFTQDHCIVLRDNTCFNPETLMQQRSFSKEGYDYAAPEQCSRPSGLPSVSVRNRTWTMSSSSDSSKPRSSTFAISRGTPMDQPSSFSFSSSSRYYPPSSSSSSSNTPAAPRQPTNFHNHNISNNSDPQAADIFSLGCIILDLLSHGLLKRSTSAFATVRSAKHKIAGRGGAVLDSSFHRNLGQVEVWMNGLSKDADKKADDTTEKGRLYKAVTPILHVVERMLAVQPGERPSAVQVQAWVYQIMTEVGGIQEPHCVHQYGRDDGNVVVGVGPEGMLGGGGDGDGTTTTTVNTSNSFLHLPMMSPIFADHPAASGSARGQASSAPTILSKRSSIFSIRTLGGHRRAGSSDETSSVGKASMYQSSSQEADRWNLGAGWVNSMQNLRIGSSKTRLWQSPSQAGSAVSS